MLEAKNSQLGCHMSQSDFEASIQESLADWQAARSLATGHEIQPIHEPPPVQSHTPITVLPDESEEPTPSSKAIIQPSCSIKVLLASGEYAALDLVCHVCNMQYAPPSNVLHQRDV